jgi:hypothetical protein
MYLAMWWHEEAGWYCRQNHRKKNTIHLIHYEQCNPPYPELAAACRQPLAQSRASPSPTQPYHHRATPGHPPMKSPR